MDYIIDPPFRNINRLFVLSFKDGDDDTRRDSFDKYYILLVQIKYFNVLNENKPFFVHPVKSKQEAYGKVVQMSRNDDYTTISLISLLHYLCHQNYHKIIGTDLSRQINTTTPQKTTFIGKLVKNDGATMFIISEKTQKTFLNFSLD